jgi:hypothetical protein
MGSHPISVGVYLSTANRISYLIVKTFLCAGCRVYLHSDVTLADIEMQKDEPGSIERAYFSWLFTEKDVAIVTAETQIPKLDVLFWELAHLCPKSPEILSTYKSNACAIVGWNPAPQEQDWWFNLKSDAAALMCCFPFSIQCGRVVIGGGRTRLRLLAPFCRVERQGYFVNPHFVHDPVLREAMFADDWAVERRRRFRLLFSGNPEPQSRRGIVTEVENFLLASPTARLIKNFGDVEEATDDPHDVLWMVRADPHDTQWATRDDVVPPKEWPGVLSDADFSLCPPGYERKTHRVVESLVRGAIPILDCPEEYDLGLNDGENCLVVRNGKWVDQVERALKMNQNDVLTMRQSIEKLHSKYLTPESAGKHWLRKCGM